MMVNKSTRAKAKWVAAAAMAAGVAMARGTGRLGRNGGARVLYERGEVGARETETKQNPRVGGAPDGCPDAGGRESYRAIGPLLDVPGPLPSGPACPPGFFFLFYIL